MIPSVQLQIPLPPLLGWVEQFLQASGMDEEAVPDNVTCELSILVFVFVAILWHSGQEQTYVSVTVELYV